LIFAKELCTVIKYYILPEQFSFQEIRNIHVGFFWLWVIAAVSAVLITSIVVAMIII